MASPIFTADELLQNAIFAELAPRMTAYQLSGVARLYWGNAAASTPRPLAVMQLQSDIRKKHKVSRGGVETLLMIRAVADDLPAAQTLRDLLNLPETLPIAGYSVTIRYEKTPNLPFDGSAHQAGQIYRISLLEE